MNRGMLVSARMPRSVCYHGCCSQGKLFTVSFYTHSPWLLAAGGDKEKVAIWEVDSVRLLASFCAHQVVVAFNRCLLMWSQLEHLTERFGSRVVSLAEVPAAFVRARQEGQPLPAAAEPPTEE